MSDFWKGVNLTLTGGNGFLGKVVLRKLHDHGAREIHVADLDRCDLRKTIELYKTHTGFQD